MTYKEALEYINETSKYGSILGLDTITELLKRLNNPQDKLKFVHIAGTNGKGSTAAYISTILAEAGYKVGRYISPAIFEYRERIQISTKDTKYISEIAVANYISSIKKISNEMVEDGFYHPTPFEIETAMAFLCFLEENCDIVVLETGLGGRLDATNIIKTTLCAVITSISMDHMQFLGDTIEQITDEKAGIIKYKVPVVSYDQVPEAIAVIREKCKEEKSNLTIVDLNNIKEVSYSLDGTTFSYKLKEHVLNDSKEHIYTKFLVRLLGENQVKNAAVAIEVVKLLIQLGYSISDEAIKRGLLFTKWEGRFDIIKRNPMLVVDGAHNKDASISLRKSIELYFKDKDLIYIMGVLADKDYDSIIKNTVDLAKLVITIAPDNSRALASNKLAKAVQNYNDNVIDAKNIQNALRIAEEHANTNDVIISFGSLSYLGEIYEFYGLHNTR